MTGPITRGTYTSASSTDATLVENTSCAWAKRTGAPRATLCAHRPATSCTVSGRAVSQADASARRAPTPACSQTRANTGGTDKAITGAVCSTKAVLSVFRGEERDATERGAGTAPTARTASAEAKATRPLSTPPGTRAATSAGSFPDGEEPWARAKAATGDLPTRRSGAAPDTKRAGAPDAERADPGVETAAVCAGARSGTRAIGNTRPDSAMATGAPRRHPHIHKADHVFACTFFTSFLLQKWYQTQKRQCHKRQKPHPFKKRGARVSKIWQRQYIQGPSAMQPRR